MRISANIDGIDEIERRLQQIGKDAKKHSRRHFAPELKYSPMESVRKYPSPTLTMNTFAMILKSGKHQRGISRSPAQSAMTSGHPKKRLGVLVSHTMALLLKTENL